MSTTPSPRRRRRWLLLLPALVVVGIAVVVGWWLVRDDAPAEVSLEDAVSQVSTTQPAAPVTTQAPVTTPAPGAAPEGLDGAWTVDTSVGEFSYTDSTGTFVGFRVREELAGIGEIDAVGRTPEVSGSLTIDGTTVVEAEIVADLAALTTDDSRRDNKVRGALGTDQYPTASFRLTEPIEFGTAAAEGVGVATQATGELTIRDVTRTVQLPLEAQLVDDVVVVVGSLRIEFTDYGVTVPSAPIVLSADDFGDVELQLFFRRS